MNLKNEIWRDVVGWEGLYKVSNLGRVKSLKSIHCKRDKILTPCNTKAGYQKILLAKRKPTSQQYIHRLVAIAFLGGGNVEEGLVEVNHKDENKKNNRVENLEWCTREYNVKYSAALRIFKLFQSLTASKT